MRMIAQQSLYLSRRLSSPMSSTCNFGVDRIFVKRCFGQNHNTTKTFYLFILLFAAIAISIMNCLVIERYELTMMISNMNDTVDISTKVGATNSNDNDNRYNNLQLRFDYTNLSPNHNLTKLIIDHQSNCSLPMSTFTYRNRYGLGSDLHQYSKGLCNGMEFQRRLRTVGIWTWMDQRECFVTRTRNSHISRDNVLFVGSAMKCYFKQSELNCPDDVEFAINNPAFDTNYSLSKPNGNIAYRCPSIIGPYTHITEEMFQTATIESLFIQVTPLVQKEAIRQLNLVFGKEPKRVPDDLITVHIRWGDKVETYKGKSIKRPEMSKVEIYDYIDAVQHILHRRTINRSATTTANIYLATEDPAAVEAFKQAMPSDWNLFVDQFMIDTQTQRVAEYNGSPKMAKVMNGKAGLLALGSLLVALEANDFVLTTKSNWSLLIDELRRSILDPRCGKCTSMIDLRPK